MINKQKFFASKQFPATAFAIGLILAVGGSVLATSIGTNLAVDGTATITGASTFTGASLHTGLATMTNGFVSQASSTVVGNLVVTGPITSSSSAVTTGFISQASSTVVGPLSIASTTTSSPLSVATSTPAAFAELAVKGDLLLGSVSTTTAVIDSSTASTGGCINLRATNGTMVRIYATSTPTAVGDANAAAMGFKNLIVEAGSCQ